jgi:hypothetical protein
MDRTNKIRTRIERQIQALEEGQLVADTGNLMGGMRDQLKSIAETASPTEAAEIAEDSDLYVTEIEEAADILAGDPEIDLAIDVDSELEKLESEVLLEQGGDMPEVPAGGEEEYISDIPMEELPAEDSKEKLQDEIKKLREELEK